MCSSRVKLEADFEADYVAGVEDDAAESTPSTVSGSLTFGGMFGPASVDLEVGTGLGFTLGLDIAPLSVNAAVDYNMPAVGDAAVEVGGGVSANLAPLTVGLDAYYGQDASDTEVDTDIALSVGYATGAMTVDLTFGANDLATGSPLAWSTALDLYL